MRPTVFHTAEWRAVVLVSSWGPITPVDLESQDASGKCRQFFFFHVRIFWKVRMFLDIGCLHVVFTSLWLFQEVYGHNDWYKKTKSKWTATPHFFKHVLTFNKSLSFFPKKTSGWFSTRAILNFSVTSIDAAHLSDVQYRCQSIPSFLELIK